MKHDSDVILERVRAAYPGVMICQLKVAHPGIDDDGLWFFTIPEAVGEIQMESSTYNLPFLIEHDEMRATDERILAKSVDRVVDTICAYLHTRKGRTIQCEQDMGGNRR